MQAPSNQNASTVRTHPLWRLALAYPLILALGYALKPALGEPAAMWPGHALAFGAYLLLPMRQWVWAALTTVGWELLASATLTNGLVAPHEPNFVLLALANVLTAAGPAALARMLRLPRGAESLSIESLPSWLLVIALGALPGALLGASTIASATGANPSLRRIGYWVFAALLAVAALGSLVNRGLRSNGERKQHPPGRGSGWERRCCWACCS